MARLQRRVYSVGPTFNGKERFRRDWTVRLHHDALARGRTRSDDLFTSVCILIDRDSTEPTSLSTTVKAWNRHLGKLGHPWRASYSRGTRRGSWELGQAADNCTGRDVASPGPSSKAEDDENVAFSPGDLDSRSDSGGDTLSHSVVAATEDVIELRGQRYVRVMDSSYEIGKKNQGGQKNTTGVDYEHTVERATTTTAAIPAAPVRALQPTPQMARAASAPAQTREVRFARRPQTGLSPVSEEPGDQGRGTNNSRRRCSSVQLLS